MAVAPVVAEAAGTIRHQGVDRLPDATTDLQIDEEEEVAAAAHHTVVVGRGHL